MNESAREKLRLIAALKDALEGMEDMIGYVPEYFQEKWSHQGYIDRAKAVLAEFDTGEEGGDREPHGDSPDRPAPGEAGLPGGSDDYLPAGATADGTGVPWSGIKADPALIASLTRRELVVNGEWYEVPDGTPLSEFFQEMLRN